MSNPQRATREMDNRDRVQTEARPVPTYLPPQLLPDVAPRDGWVHRWVRISLLSKADNTNVSARFREGWEPCKADEYPELQLMAEPGSRYPGGLEVGGLLLCRAPKELMDARKAYYQKSTADNMAAVDANLMKENDPRMPLFKESRTTTSFGSGRK